MTGLKRPAPDQDLDTSNRVTSRPLDLPLTFPHTKSSEEPSPLAQATKI